MLKLHGYWRSTASYRVRLALALKGLDYAQTTYDIRTGVHKGPAYRAIAPHGLAPALETGDGVIIESLAILEWLEERFPDPPLLPKGAMARAHIRSMAALVAADIHPLNTPRVTGVLRERFDADDAGVQTWMERWMGDGFAALEILVARHGNGFAFGDTPSLADCLLAPQVYAAERFKVDLAPFPRVRAAAGRLLALPAAQAAHPDRQPDADRP